MTLERPRNRTQLVTWALIALAITYAVAAGGAGSNGINNTVSRVAAAAVLVVALAVWLVTAARDPFWRPRTSLAAGFAAALGALAIALLGSTQPRLGFDYVAYAALLVGGYLLLQRLFAHRFFGPRLGALSVLLGLGLAVIYLVVVLLKWVLIWISLGRFVAPPLRPGYESLGLGDPSGLAAILLLLFIAAACQLGLGTRTRRRIVLTHAAVATVAIFLTGSRSAWLALAVTVVVVGALWLWAGDRRAEIWRIARTRGFRKAAVGIGFAGFVAAILFSRAVASRLGEPAGDTRTAFTHASVSMFAEDPVTGVGPGMWVVERIASTQPPDVDYYIPHAHNLVLQTLAELGLVGAAAGVVVAAVLLRLVRRGLRSPDALARRLGWATVASTVFLVVLQLFSNYANLPALWLCFGLVVARLDALMTADDAPMPNRVFAPVGLALAVGIGGAGAWLAMSERAALANDAAVGAANAADWTAAEVSARVALDMDPAMTPYAFTLGLAEAHTGQPEEALAHLRASAAIDDYPIAWLNVARLELDLGRPDAGRAALANAMRLGYQQPQVALGASLMYLELGDRPPAVAALAQALVVAPALASDPWWDATGRRSLLEDALTAAIANATPETGYRLALEGERPEAAAALVGVMAAEQRTIPGLVVRAWAGDKVAFDDLHARAFDDPMDITTVALCRRLALHSSVESHLAVPWRCDDAGAPDIPIVIRIDAPDYGEWAPVPGLPGPDASVHVIYVYRRLAPLDKLVPGIPAVVPRFG